MSLRSPAAPESTCPFVQGDLVGDRFRVQRVIGEGSHGWVMAAHDQKTGLLVALKMLKDLSYSTWMRMERRELRLLSRLQDVGNAHIARIVESTLLVHEGRPFLVLELIAGPSLRDVLAERSPLSIIETVRIGLGLARGLQAIHFAGGIHRDLKPDNVRMRSSGEPVIVDLGVARALWETQVLTVRGKAPFSPRYAAPEQHAGHLASPATDVYALGVCLFEMLTGRNESPANPSSYRRDIPPRLAALVESCLMMEPAARPQLTRIISELQQLAHPSRPQLLPLFFMLSSFFSFDVPALARSDACMTFDGFAVVEGSRDFTRADGVPRLRAHHRKILPNATEGAFFRLEVPHIEPSMFVVLPGEQADDFEIFGWEADTCHRYRFRACEGQNADLLQPISCAMPRPMSMRSIGIAIGDVDNDANDDLVVWHQVPGSAERPVAIAGFTQFRAKQGSGRLIENAFDLSELKGYSTTAVRRLGDVDGDGFADLIVLDYPTGGICETAVWMLLGDGTGHFSPPRPASSTPIPLPANLSDLGDVDEDGYLDLLTGPDDDGDPGQTFLLRGNGHGFGHAEPAVDVNPAIESAKDEAGHGATYLEDWNGDGHLDAIVTFHPLSWRDGRDWVHTHVFLGSGDGSFSAKPDFSFDKKLAFFAIRGR